MTSQPAVRDETPSPSVVVPTKPQARRFTAVVPHFGTFSPFLISSPKPQPSKNPPTNAPLIDHSIMLSGHQLFRDQAQENSWLHEMLNLVSDGEDFISIDKPDFDWGDLDDGFTALGFIR